MVEGNIILIAACVPTLHPVYDKFANLVSVRCSPLPTERDPTADHRRFQRPQEQIKSFWSAITPSFGTDEVQEADLPRTLEEAANLAYPPAAIWNPAVRQHSRVQAHRRNSCDQ